MLHGLARDFSGEFYLGRERRDWRRRHQQQVIFVKEGLRPVPYLGTLPVRPGYLLNRQFKPLLDIARHQRVHPALEFGVVTVLVSVHGDKAHSPQN